MTSAEDCGIQKRLALAGAAELVAETDARRVVGEGEQTAYSGALDVAAIVKRSAHRLASLQTGRVE